MKPCNTGRTAETLEEYAAMGGLGGALEAAWRHGQEVGHILKDLDGEPVLRSRATDGCRYEFIHVPVRRIRSDVAELRRAGITNASPDPFGLVFHDDGLITANTLLDALFPEITDDVARQILGRLVALGALARAHVNSRQVQFTDPRQRRELEDSGEPLYVHLECADLRAAVSAVLQEVFGPPPESDDAPFHAALDHVAGRLSRRSACNYCSAATLFPQQVTISTARVRRRGGPHSDDLHTARDYQFGFTFAPVDDPATAFHVLAWDHPLVDQTVLNMTPHDRSFSDLVRLVRVINRDIARDAEAYGALPFSLSGACNHLAGNTVFHQHYQLFHLPDLPLPRVCDVVLAERGTTLLGTPHGVEVHRLGDAWPVPAYLLRSTQEDQAEAFCEIADLVACLWAVATDVAEPWSSQNIWAWSRGSELRALFLPRDRGRADAEATVHSASSGTVRLAKQRAGVLEMMGWFVIDSPSDYELIATLSPRERQELGDTWLAALAPPRLAAPALDWLLRDRL